MLNRRLSTDRSGSEARATIGILAGGIACLSLAGCITNSVNTSASPNFVQSVQTVQSVRAIPSPGPDPVPRPVTDAAPRQSAASPPVVLKPAFRPTICNDTDFDVHIASAGEWFGQPEPMIRGWLAIAPHNCKQLPAFRTAEHYLSATSRTPSGSRNWFGTGLSKCVPHGVFAMPFSAETFCSPVSFQVGFRRASTAAGAIRLRNQN